MAGSAEMMRGLVLLTFRILGPLAIFDGSVVVEVQGRRQQLLLTALLLHANRTLSVDWLVDAVWEGAAPATAPAQIRDRIRLLRRDLSRCPSLTDPATVLATSIRGYRLSLAPSCTDLAQFETTAHAGRVALAAGAFDDAAGLLRDALEVWRDVPLAGLDASWLSAAFAGWQERRQSALEDRIGADLACGRHNEVIVELVELVAEYPLRERLHEQLIVALAASGRTAEALAQYQATRRTLAQELGVEPGPQLRHIHQQLLRGDMDHLVVQATYRQGARRSLRGGVDRCR